MGMSYCMLYCMLYVAVPACVIEKRRAFASMGRSRALTRGYRWPIFGLFLILRIVLIGLVSLAGILLVMAGIRQITWLLFFGLQVVAAAFDGILVAGGFSKIFLPPQGG